MAELSVVGKSVSRIDILEKVTGRAQYTSEMGTRLPGLLYGKMLFSPLPHARIVHIDTSRAEVSPGVKIVLTGEDVPDVRAGALVSDQSILTRDRARFVGDAIAAVAATSLEAAEEARDLIKVEYEELPVLSDPEEAMKPDCKAIIHPNLCSYKRPIYSYLGNDLPGPNVHTHHKIRRGDVADGFKEADLIVENRYSLPRISHVTLEPFNAVASVDSDGVLTVWTSSHQIYSGVQVELCRDFNLPPSKVRIMAHYVGGNFGAVSQVERFTALLAMKLKKPVKLVLTRKESLLGPNRLPAIVYIKDGVKKDGTLVAREMNLICNAGAYAGKTGLIIRNGSFVTSQYRIPNFKWDAYGVYTNEPHSTAFRGFGSESPAWAMEQQMDIIAEKLGIDPAELRKKNIVKEGEQNNRGETTHSIGAAECVDKVDKWMRKETPIKPSNSNIKIGRGIALANKYTMIDTISAATVKVHKDGIIELRCGIDATGQGSGTVLSQIAAEEFHTSMDKIRIIWGDTTMIPYDYGSVSSRTTLYMGNAVRLASNDAKQQLFKMAASSLAVNPEDLEIKNGKIYVKQSPEKMVDISALFVMNTKGAQQGALCLSEGGELLGNATFMFRDLDDEDHETGQGKRLTASYCYIAQAVEVAVDIETGLIKVLRFGSASDMGQPINPKMCEGQLDGGAGMGISSTLYEEIQIKEGLVLNTDLHDYRVVTMKEVPSGNNITSMIVSALHRDGPFGAKGAGEAACTPSAPAIANAVYDAVGIRIKDLPITPEKVLALLKKQGIK